MLEDIEKSSRSKPVIVFLEKEDKEFEKTL
jgi:hypothetical protein